MKTYLWLFLCFFVHVVSGQESGFTISGVITDEEGDAVPFANVTVFQGDHQLCETTSDFDGNYELLNVDPGKYMIRFSFVGYQTTKVKGLIINTENIVFDPILKQGIVLPSLGCCCYVPPVFEKDQTTTGKTFS